MKRQYLFLVLAIILTAGLRLWRLDTDLLFHRDQGMHAMGIKPIWTEGEIKLLGHSTDVDGIFHSPLFYWLMAIPYGASGGSPAAASAFQIILEVLTLPLFYLAIKRLFGSQTARLTLILYAVSYGMIGYSRWLSNVTPILPLSHLLLFLVAYDWHKKRWYWLSLGLILGLISQMNGAVGFAYTPAVLWAVKPKLTKLGLAQIFSGLVLPAIPQLAFEFRHDFVITKGILRFFGSGDGSSGLPGASLPLNIKNYLGQVGLLASNYLPAAAIILWSVGLFLTRKLASRRLILSLVLVPMIALALFKRGAFGFFYVASFGLMLALISHAVASSRNYLFLGAFLFILGLNLYADHQLLTPAIGLVPIGSANLITLQDRKNVLDWVYQMAGKEPFAVWNYTLPYYQDDALTYMFLWYGQGRYGYLPEKVSSFSPGEVKIKHFFALYEPDWDRPWRLEEWRVEVIKNWGAPIATYHSHDWSASWHKLN